jgi:hypothetical protein
MSLMLVVMLVMTTITVTLVRTAFDNQSSSRDAAARAEARLYASAVLEEFYARVGTDPEFLRAVLAADTDAAGAPEALHPALRRSADSDGAWALLPMPSARLEGKAPTPAGSLPCVERDALRRDCYYLKVYAPETAPGVLPPTVVIEATLRTRCAGTLTRCIYSRFQQRLRRTQFFDFALAQELATLAPEALFPAGSFDESGPNRDVFVEYRSRCANRRGLARSGVTLARDIVAGTSDSSTGRFTAGDPTDSQPLTGCVDMAYQSDADGSGGDTLTGPIYTADDFITVCGSPQFSPVYVSGPGWGSGAATRKVYRVPSDPGCVGSAPSLPPTSATGVPMLLQPPALDVLGDASSAVDARGATVSEILEKSDPDQPAVAVFDEGIVTFSNVTITDAVSCRTTGGGGVECPVDGRVLVLRNPDPSSGSSSGSTDLHVSGVVAGMVSLVVEGSVAIVDDLVYRGGGVRTNTEDVLTLTATERIEIWQACAAVPSGRSARRSDACIGAGSAAATDPVDRRVHGILTSSLGYVGVPDWQTNTDADGLRTQETLTFFGSVASRYQGVYGAYASAGTANRTLVSGFYKNFTHDNLSRILSDAAGRETIEEQLPFFVQTETAVWNRLDVSEVPCRDGCRDSTTR